ncbi:MAG: CoA pyrophosphatase [Candidatus Eremiobacteraeota bacterium]|nr:CoA pyrophosphatase [Candidatus Eremiobacteraeota bacterium]MBC5820576.1 CoA pyrophosphatase [Candidatus Eremiobacteraeota bacterium]
MLFAAVVVPIVLRSEPTLIVVRRAVHLRRNPDQIAFPGGLVDAADRDPQTTALREFEEELGIPRERAAIAARLDDVVTLARSVTIAPFVATLEPPLAFTPDPAETQSVHEIPLPALYAPGALHLGRERVAVAGEMRAVRSWLFDHGGVHVWGATARIMHALLRRYPTCQALAAATAVGTKPARA